MIKLSDEQHRAVTAQPGLAVRLIDRDTHETFVLLPTKEYERLSSGAYDCTPWADEEMDMLAAEDADRLGWKGMEAYQEPMS
jgi:hypothetical protein